MSEAKAAERGGNVRRPFEYIHKEKKRKKQLHKQVDKFRPLRRALHQDKCVTAETIYLIHGCFRWRRNSGFSHHV
jgi:hypothetical protein